MELILATLKRWLADPTVVNFITVGLGSLVILLFFRIIRNSVGHYIPDSDLRYRVRKIVMFVSYIVIVLFAASVFSTRLGQFTVIFGAVGAGVAFALQEVIVSFAGWVAISLGQFYKPGDRVQLGGIMGDVIDIGFLRTTLMECGAWVKADLYNGRIVRVANSFVFREPVYNYSADFHFLWDELSLPIKYGSDRALMRNILQQAVDEVVADYVPLARQELNQMVRKYLIEAATVEPAITVYPTDNWLEYTVRYVVDYKKRRGIKDLLFRHILDAIDQSQGKVAIASTTIHIVETPTLDLRWQRPQRPRPEDSPV